MFLVSCLMLLGASEESNWYFTASAFLETSELKSDYLGTVKFDDESAFRFGLGTKLNEDWNLEFEFGTSEAYGIDSFDDPVFAEYSQSCFMVSRAIAIDEKVSLSPRAGIGITSWDLLFLDGFGSVNADSGTDVTTIFGLNMEIEIADNVQVYGGYRMQFTDVGGLYNAEATQSGLMFGASFSF